ncbi:TPA: hypothetical protein ACH3X1_002245 [Trebouxia sp. C0004]
MSSTPQQSRSVSRKINVKPAAPLLSYVPISVLTDSYKTTHYMQYPESRKMVAYAEFRNGFDKDVQDTRVVFYGIRYLLEGFIARQWTQQDVDKATTFFSTHMAPNFTDFPFPKDLMVKFVQQNDGYFPVVLETLPEGTCVHAHCPVFQITAEDGYAPLCTFLETILTMLWYPTTVATLSRRARDRIEAAFDQSVEGGSSNPLVGTRLHDFGFRGCTCVEQSVLGGVAHLLNFSGSDTLSAAYYAQFHLNDGEPVAMSIPATEHSVMTAWRTEREALENMIDQFGTGIFACVMDSYDYVEALAEHLPAVAQKQVGKGGFLVLRPDSGDPVEAVLLALEAAERVFGVDMNSRGYKVPKGCGVIQGDGISIEMLDDILQAVMAKGYSAQAVAFGMGGGLLQRVNRDTMSFATKLSHIVYADGTEADTMKLPKSDPWKYSLPGIMAVKSVKGIPTAFPADGGHVSPEENMLQVVWDNGPVEVEWKKFAELRQDVDAQWRALPKAADVLSQPLKDKVKTVTARLRAHQDA